jgi:hypothetical protein
MLRVADGMTSRTLCKLGSSASAQSEKFSLRIGSVDGWMSSVNVSVQPFKVYLLFRLFRGCVVLVMYLNRTYDARYGVIVNEPS